MNFRNVVRKIARLSDCERARRLCLLLSYVVTAFDAFFIAIGNYSSPGILVVVFAKADTILDKMKILKKFF